MVASAVPAPFRDRVASITSDVVMNLNATPTQMALNSDDEADAAVRDAHICVEAATSALSRYVDDTIRSSHEFE
jgi:hypothetical protein